MVPRTLLVALLAVMVSTASASAGALKNIIAECCDSQLFHYKEVPLGDTATVPGRLEMKRMVAQLACDCKQAALPSPDRF